MSAISLQKFCGTFCSSLLIESRLVVNRRCLWPTIGAHMAYNSLTCVLPWVEAMHRATMQTAINGVFGAEAVVGAFGGPIWARPGPAWVPLLFVGQCLVVHAVFLRLVVGEFTATTSVGFLLLHVAPSVSCPCLDTRLTRRSNLPPSPAVSRRLPPSPAAFQCVQPVQVYSPTTKFTPQPPSSG